MTSVAIRVGQFDVRSLATPGHASHHNVYHWDDNLFGGDVAGVRLDGGPPVPPFVPPELQVESWLESIEQMRALEATRLYLPHFGLVEGDLTAHFDALEERVRRWATWFRDELRKGRGETELDSGLRALRSARHSRLRRGPGAARGLRASRPKLHGRDGVHPLLAEVSSRSGRRRI